MTRLFLVGRDPISSLVKIINWRWMCNTSDSTTLLTKLINHHAMVYLLSIDSGIVLSNAIPILPFTVMVL